MKLLLPLGGMSSRFPSMRPKYLLTFPNGDLMIERVIKSMDLKRYDEIIVIPKKEALDKYCDQERMEKLLKACCPKKTIKIIPISSSSSQVDTCLQGLQESGYDKLDVSFGIKDCDNTFTFPNCEGNTLAFVDLNNEKLGTLSSPHKKSWLEIDENGRLTTLVEKRVISNKFSCGYYQFVSSKEFCNSANRLMNKFADYKTEIYTSHLIFEMLAKGVIFNVTEARDYKDYGDLESFTRFNESCTTIFSDFDGVLVENSSKFAPKPWDFKPIKENLNALKDKLSRDPYSQLIITTSRPSYLKEEIIKFLADHGLMSNQVICDLPHAKRILINDFSKTNIFPTAIAVNIERNSTNLADYI